MSRYQPPYNKVVPGWVYVLTCPGFPGCCKIGGTKRTAKHRAGELMVEGDYATGQPFTVFAREPASDWFAVETDAHRMLSDRRLPRSELFRCTPKEAHAVVRAAARAHRHPWLGWLLPRRRPAPTGWQAQRHRRDDTAGYIALVVLVVVGLVVWLKPALPSWMPPSVTRVALMLERLHRD